MTTAKPEPRSKQAPVHKKADWDAIQRDYRTGQYTLRELEARHGVHNATIFRHAKNEGWTQDLSIAIRLATDAKLIQGFVATECRKSQQKTVDTVLAAADFNAGIILNHRARLIELASSIDKAKDSILLLGASVSGIREAAVFMQAVCGLATATKILIEQERKAHGLDSASSSERSGQDDFADFLADLSARGSRLPIAGVQ